MYPSDNNSGSNWPWNGEIDILEGVHDNVHNQVTFHTGDGALQLDRSTLDKLADALISPILPRRRFLPG